MNDNLKLIDEIRKKTKIQHAAAEGKFTMLLNDINSMMDYADLLQTVFGFMNPLEKVVHKHIDITSIPDIAQRRNTSLLLSDMSSIGYPSTTTTVADIDFVSDTYTAIGALYVMEGSALGGNIIAKIIKHKLSLTTGTAYF